jgi:uncharacterized protein YndB with AHSA1/START domain
MKIERTYRASVEDVWDLWTTKEGFASWWGPVGYHVVVHALDARVGGELRYDMAADDGSERHPTHGTFTEVTPHRRLALTHVIDFLPGLEPYRNTMTVELFPSGDQVRMVVTLERLHDEAFTNMQIEGFTSQLTKLDRRFSR